MMVGSMLGRLASLLASIPDPLITGPPPPPVDAPLGLGAPIVILTLLALVWTIARRFTKAGTLRAARVGVFGAAIGNALMDLAAIMQPDRPRVVEIQQVLEEGRRRTDEANGDPPDQTGHGSRQTPISASTSSTTRRCMSMRRRSVKPIQVSMHSPTQPVASTITSVEDVATG